MKKIDETRPHRRSRCDIRRENDHILMQLEMPGVNKSGLDISIENDRLIIQGRRGKQSDKGRRIAREIPPGDYRMEYTIDETIDRGAVEAALDKGILTLTMGLSESVKPRKIEVLAKS